MSPQLLENMTEVVRKGIQEAQVQLQKANEERLLEEVRPRRGHPSTGTWATGSARPGLKPNCSAGRVTADSRGWVRAELVFSRASLPEGKNL